MKAVVVKEPFRYEVIETDMPEIKDDYEVLVKMKAAGVCGSDFHIYRGENPCASYPRIPGHENVGVIEKTGSKVTSVKPGDRVVIDLIITCGTCYQCRIGRENVCENVLVRGSGTDGGWREYITAPETDVYKLPGNVDFKDAVLIEPFCIGAHSTNRGRVTGADKVLILGAGTIGNIILEVCKEKGAEAICCDIDQNSLERAKRYGADHVINTKTHDMVSEVQRITGGKGVTVAFDSACFEGSLTSILMPGILCNAGRAVSLGFTTAAESISQAMIDQRELDVIGSRMSCYQFADMARKFGEGAFNLDGIITHFIPFDEVDQVFRNMDHRDPSVKKMAIVFD